MTATFLKKPEIRRLRYRLLCFAAETGITLAGLVPRRIGLLLFSLAGALVYSVPHKDKTRTFNHLRMIYGGRWTGVKIRTVARSVYRELGKNLFDSFYLSRLDKTSFDGLVKHDPLDAVEAAYRKGKGGVVITAHTGCFEMLLQFFAVHGFKSFAIGRKLHDEQLDRIIRGTRTGDNYQYIDRSEPPRKIIRFLSQGMLFGVLVDQDTAVEGVFADFLGKPAFTPSGPVKLAMKFSIPVFVATTARQPDGTHYVYLSGPLQLKSTGDIDMDLVENMTEVNKLIGRTIEQFPEQWVWMHRRWNRKPEGN
ncbi:MAG: lysophospholipid acyltransferase family protein [Candidatus Pacearchaeota archaeon]|nr:lysophospholipid acyltransferase family protein [Candidatus Pacearchaeota archaeon]